MRIAVCALLLILVGCSRGPSYEEALNIYNLECAELERQAKAADTVEMIQASNMGKARELAEAELRSQNKDAKPTVAELDAHLEKMGQSDEMIRDMLKQYRERSAKLNEGLAKQQAIVDAAKARVDELRP